MPRKTKNQIERTLDDDLLLLDELLREEMYEQSEKSLYKFIVNFWNTFEPAILRNNWHIECIAEHTQAVITRDIRRLIINIPPRMCLPGNIEILLSDGSYTTISKIKPGQLLKSSDGKKIVNNAVLAKWNTGLKPCYEIITSDGNKLTASKDHRIYTTDGFKTPLELTKQHTLCIYKKTSSHKEYLSYAYVRDIRYVGEHECYDIEVENESTYFAEDILVHNSKSLINSICFPVWSWINHPHEKFWLISHTAKLFVQNIVYARRILEHPQYKERWCNEELNPEHYRFSLSSDVNTKTRIENIHGGYLLGGSPTSGALGMGYSIAVLDDILDSEESNSPIAIQAVNDWFTQTFLNRSNDVNTDAVIIVMQRLNSMDITAYVQEKYGDQNWFLLNLPAKYDPERTFISPIGYNDKRTKKNQLLDPYRLPDEFLETQAKNPIIYNTRYQQNPDATEDGNVLKAEYIIQRDYIPNSFTALMTSWDLSISDNPTSCYTVGLVVGKYEDEYWVLDMIRKQIEIPEQLDAIRKLKTKYPRATIGIEAKANGKPAMSLLRREIKDIYAFEPRLFGGDKESRFNAIIPYFRDKKILIYNPSPFKNLADVHSKRVENDYSADEIIKELKSFPIGRSDDIVDALSYAVQWLAEYGAVSEGMITKGERIILTDDDYVSRNRSTEHQLFNRILYNPLDYYLSSNIPSRDDLNAITW